MYTAYRTQPILIQNERTGEWHFVRWVKLGIVKDMADAKAQFGGSPVLEVAR